MYMHNTGRHLVMPGAISSMPVIQIAGPGSGQVASDILLSGHLYRGQACGAGDLWLAKKKA